MLLNELTIGDITRPSVRYTFVREPGVTNITVQDVCPAHRTEHYGFNYAPVAQGIVEDPLTGTAWRDHCTGTGPER